MEGERERERENRKKRREREREGETERERERENKKTKKNWGFGEKEVFWEKKIERPRQDCFFQSKIGFLQARLAISSEWDKDCKNQAFKPIYPSRSVFLSEKRGSLRKCASLMEGFLEASARVFEGSPGLCGVLLGSTTGFFPGVVTLCL